MKTRYAIMATDTKGDVINVFTDKRTYKNLAYAKRKLLVMEELICGQVGMHVATIKTETFCPHCKHALDLELGEREVKS